MQLQISVIKLKISLSVADICN